MRIVRALIDEHVAITLNVRPWQRLRNCVSRVRRLRYRGGQVPQIMASLNKRRCQPAPADMLGEQGQVDQMCAHISSMQKISPRQSLLYEEFRMGLSFACREALAPSCVTCVMLDKPWMLQSNQPSIL